MLDAVIIGSGPYGLSIAAYFRKRGLKFRIFGPPMESWRAHMPKGMLLKSEGDASDLYDPDNHFTLKSYCASRRIKYADNGVPVRLDTFTNYGLAFADRCVPGLENRIVSAVDRPVKEYLIRLADGERVEARRVVMAVGISYFDYIPPNLSALPGDLLSHTSKHADLSSFRGRKVIVVGGGSSAMDTAALLVDAGVDVQMVSRREALKFPPKPTGEAPSLLQRLRRPPSGLGNGLRRRFLCNRPQAFHYLPERLRLYTVRRALGPAGGWFSKDMVVGRVPLRLGYVPEHSEVKDGMAHLHLRRIDGSRLVIAADHVIAATGYRVAVDRLTLLSQNIRSNLACVNDSPILSGDFEASIPGLYFVGLASANSFGPVMRFAVGARFTAERVTAAVVKSVVREQRK